MRVPPAVVDDTDECGVEILLRHALPVQHDPHALGRHACHGVIVVTEQGHPHHGHSMVHGLIDAVQPAVAEEGPSVGVT